jgi:hypothetical protein
MRAKAIKNSPQINKEYSVDQLLKMLAEKELELGFKDKLIQLLEKILKEHRIDY